jgi:hypothetical protein
MSVTHPLNEKEALFAMREVAADNTPQDIVKLQFPADVAYSLVALCPEMPSDPRLKTILHFIGQYTIAGHGENYRTVDCRTMLHDSGHTQALVGGDCTSGLAKEGFIHRATNGEWVIVTDKEKTAAQREKAQQNPPRENMWRVLQLLKAGQQQGKGLFDAKALNACIAASDAQWNREHTSSWVNTPRVKDAELAELAALGFLNVHPPKEIEFQVLPAPERDRKAAALKNPNKKQSLKKRIKGLLAPEAATLEGTPVGASILQPITAVMPVDHQLKDCARQESGMKVSKEKIPPTPSIAQRLGFIGPPTR